MRRAIVIAVSVAAVATVADAGERWQWSVTPYIWATDISEDLIVDGAVVGGGDTDFNDLVDKIDASIQLHFEGIGDRWGVFADVSAVEISDSETGELGVVRLDVEIDETVGEIGAIYRPGGREGRLDLLLGARMLWVDERYTFQLGAPEILRQVRVDEDYVDALVGARYTIPLSERWAVSLRGDLSFGGTDLVWTAQGLVGWKFGAKRQSAIFAAYRYRDMEYGKADVVEVDKTLSGFGLGVKIGF
jgi:hypothetical protein